MLFFYRRIFPVKRFVILSVVTGAATLAWCIALIFSIIFSCKPVQFFWDKNIPGGRCLNENSLSYGITAANIATDIAVLVLPLPWLWRLQMNFNRKVAISGIFLLGCLYVSLLGFRSSASLTCRKNSVCIAGIVRIPLLAQLKEYDVTCEWTTYLITLANRILNGLKKK